MFKKFFQKFQKPKESILEIELTEEFPPNKYVLHVSDGEKWIPYAPRNVAAWIQNTETKRWECSNCWQESLCSVSEDGTIRIKKSHFCPHCGNKMED